MIETAPSIRKNAIKTNVSESAPVTGDASSIAPTIMPSAADNSDHQKPGACRIQKVVTRPTMPLTRNSQPNRMVTANVGDRRQDDSSCAQHQQHNAFDKEENPVFTQCDRCRTLNTLNAGLLGGHGRLRSYLPSQKQYSCSMLAV